MKKNIFLLLVLIILNTPMLTIGNDNTHPGDIARNKYPKAYLTTKIIGGTTGTFLGVALATLGIGLGIELTLKNKDATFISKSIDDLLASNNKLLMLLILTLFAGYIGSKAGETISKIAWNTTWNGIDKLQKIKESTNNQ